MSAGRQFNLAAGQVRVGVPRRIVAVLMALSAAGLGGTACTAQATHRQLSAGLVVARTRPPTAATSVLAGPPGAVAVEAARELFASSPAVIVADADSRSALAAAAIDAARLHAPLLLASPQARAEIEVLRPRAVLAVGVPAAALAPAPTGTRVLTSVVKLHVNTMSAALSTVVLLVHRGDLSPQAIAVMATARAAGVRIVVVRGYDPRADPAAISAIAAARTREVLALGAGFGPTRLLAARAAVAATGIQLPGGGEVLFPARRLLALYGHPGTPGLGALGQQDLTASIARARRLAARYRPLSRVPVIPTFEIIASVAQGTSEPEGGTYSYLTPAAEIRPWVTDATRAGMYVILDLQAGRASLLAQAKRYQSLLELPDVGLAIDPEWKLKPGQLPLRQIGGVTSAQVNEVADWLATLTARYHLPQKLLVLHQFRLSMISDEHGIDTRHDDLAIVIHMDGQGTPDNKRQTWDAITGAAPRGVYFGWKDFFTKDHPMLTPSQTMARTPQPVMISYQ